MGMAFSLADYITAQYHEVGVAHFMPGTEGFTMATFNGALVPDSVLVYARVGNAGFKEVGMAGSLPATDGGFTAACFKAADVPVGTRLFINVV